MKVAIMIVRYAYMRPVLAKATLFAVTVAGLLACHGDTVAPPEMSLEIPEVGGKVDANGFATFADLPKSGISTLFLRIGSRQSGSMSYGSIHTKINTEAADDITTKRSTSDGVLCELDLRHWGEGFNLRPGRNSVEAYYTDRYQRIHYASFLLQFAGQTPAQNRKGRTGPPQKITGQKYAVVVGISKYKNYGSDKQLKYPRNDAVAFLEFLKSPRGGGFLDDSEHVRLLLDEEATSQNLRSALRTFLTNPEPDDLVVIYFAGHGEPDPNDPRSFYLLTYDTQPKDMGGTAFPMEELGDVFGRIIQARHVISFVDSCNSFGISGARAKTTGQNDLTNQYLLRYGSARKSFAIITASDVSERSYEGAQWGGGHGVFTYYLLEGLKGKAASDPKSDSVTAGDLFAYLREQVPRATAAESAGEQHPQSLPGLEENLLLAGARSWQAARTEHGETKRGIQH